MYIWPSILCLFPDCAVQRRDGVLENLDDVDPGLRAAPADPKHHQQHHHDQSIKFTCIKYQKNIQEKQGRTVHRSGLNNENNKN